MNLSKNVLQFERLIKQYSYAELINLRNDIIMLRDTLGKLLNNEFNPEKQVVIIAEISIIQANIQIVNMSINYLNNTAVRNTQFGQLSLN